MHSVLLEPLYFGLYLLLPLGILWADRTGKIVKNLYLRFGYICLIYLAILLSLARGAIVASTVVGVLGLIYNFSELKKSLKIKDLTKIAVAGTVLIALLFVCTSLLGKKGTDEDHNYKKGFSTITGHLETIKPWGNKEDKEKQDSIDSRDEARSQAWNTITASKKNLLIGVGAGQYGKSFEDTSNFVLLDVWVEYGLVGVVVLVTFFGSVFVSVFRSRRDGLSPIERVLVVGAGLYLVGFIIQSITFGELGITHLWGVLALALGVTTCNQKN
jgi:cell division protein FtsW (lipid II flippase)